MRSVCLMFLLFALKTQGVAQRAIISTAAGQRNISTPGGDGGLFKDATFNHPNFMIYDKAGNLYFSELRSGLVRRVDAVTKKIATLVSGLSSVEGIAFTSDESYMYIVSKGSGTVHRYTMQTGQLTLFAGTLNNACSYYPACGENGPALSAVFDNPSGVAVDRKGNVYIADQHDSRIRKVDITTGIITTFSNAPLLFPNKLIFDDKGNLYIADSGLSAIFKVDSTGNSSVYAGIPYANSGLRTADGLPADQTRFGAPTGISFDKDYNMYVTEEIGSTIRRIDAKTKIVTTLAGTPFTNGYSGDCGDATLAKLFAPGHAVITPEGTLLISDRANEVFREVVQGFDNIIYSTKSSICSGDTLHLTNQATGGTWLSDNPLVAKVTSEGLVQTFSGGNAIITYSLYDRCAAAYSASTFNLSVRQTPTINRISGRDSVCEKSTTSFSNLTAGGSWSSADASVASISSIGSALGLKKGTTYIKYSVTQNNCTAVDSLRLVIIPLPIVTKLKDTTACVNSSFTLVNNSAGGHWSTDDSTILFLKPNGQTYANKTGTALVKYVLVNSCGADKDSSTVYVKPLPTFSLGRDTALCAGTVLTLSFTGPNLNYRWQDGSTNNSLTISGTGNYSLQVSDINSCSFSDTISVVYNSLPVFSLGRDTVLCETAHLLLTPQRSDIDFYRWQDGSAGNSYAVQKPGDYWVSVTDKNGCAYADTVNITYSRLPYFTLPEQQNICNGQQIILDPKIDADKFRWQDGSQNKQFKATTAGIYTLTATNTCGNFSASTRLIAGVCYLVMPDAFTPNHDGLNDVFRLKNPAFVKVFHLTVFNRNGQIIYDSTDPNKGWDGNYKGQPQGQGTYIWKIELVNLQDETESATGTVVLIR